MQQIYQEVRESLNPLSEYRISQYINSYERQFYSWKDLKTPNSTYTKAELQVSFFIYIAIKTHIKQNYSSSYSYSTDSSFKSEQSFSSQNSENDEKSRINENKENGDKYTVSNPLTLFQMCTFITNYVMTIDHTELFLDILYVLSKLGFDQATKYLEMLMANGKIQKRLQIQEENICSIVAGGRTKGRWNSIVKNYQSFVNIEEN